MKTKPNQTKPNRSRWLRFSFAAMMVVAGMFIQNEDALGQCSLCGGTAFGIGSVAIGSTAIAGTTSNNYAYGIGRNSYAQASGSYTFGSEISTSTSSLGNAVIGTGYSSVNFTNSIDHSIMIGTRLYGSVPTVYIEDALASSEDFGNVGIGTINPESRLHVYDEIRVGETGEVSGSLVFNNSAGNTITFNTPTSMSNQNYTLPLAQGANNSVLTTDASGNLSWAAPGTVSNAWLTTGNSGTTAGTNFLGTTDAVDLVVKTNGTEKMRVKSGGNVGIGTNSPSGSLHVMATATGTQEKVARFGVTGATGGQEIQILNRSTTAAEYAPWIECGTNTTANAGLYLSARIQDAGNSGTTPAMIFAALRANFADTLNRPLFSWRSHSTHMLMDANGRLGIGTTSPSGKLHVAGTAYVNTLPPNGSGNRVGIGTGNQLTDWDASSMHFKDNIEALEFDKQMFLSMRPVVYNWKEIYGGNLDVGFIAQEVAIDFPPLATIRPKHEILPDGTIVRDTLGRAIVDSTQFEPYSVKYGRLPVYLFMLAKQQDSMISELTQRVNQLQSLVESCCSQPAYRLSEPPTETHGSDKLERNEFVLLQNDPNPFADYTDIRVSVPESAKNVSLLIVDMKGAIVLSTPLATSSETIRVYSSDIGKGIFTYYLLNEGNVVASRKMVSSK